MYEPQDAQVKADRHSPFGRGTVVNVTVAVLVESRCNVPLVSASRFGRVECQSGCGGFRY